ncbi:MAG: hypothetical protein ACE5DY_04500 [Mariprofundaceae bacterium]
MPVKPLSFGKLIPTSLLDRNIEVDGEDFGSSYRAGESFADFLCSLPGLGVSARLLLARDAIVSAHRHEQRLILGCGAAAITSGLNPVIIHLLEAQLVGGLVLTGEACAKDVEIALSGSSFCHREDDIPESLSQGTAEAGQLINEALAFGAGEGWGIGKAVGRKLLDSEYQHLDHSLLAIACHYGIPATVLPVIGGDSFNLHPLAHGESLGATGHTDFRVLTTMVAGANRGVLINVASSLIPKLFLQSVDAARNLGNPVEKLTFVEINPAPASPLAEDTFRCLAKPDGQSLILPGPSEILLPLLFASVLDAIGVRA